MFPISQFTYTKKRGLSRQKTDSTRNRSLLNYIYNLSIQEQDLSYAVNIFSQNELWSDQKRNIADQLLTLQKTLVQIEKVITPTEIHAPKKGKYALITSTYFLYELVEAISSLIENLPEKNLKTLITGDTIRIRHHLQDLKTGLRDLINQMNSSVMEGYKNERQ
jgi:hypothetical protein